jgi:hypothetical protein
MPSSFFKSHRNSSAAVAALFGLFLLYLGIAVSAESGAGGQDSWNHYLYARWCYKHPMLILDLWGKPFFTLLASPFAQMGINAVYGLNMVATLATAWITYMIGRKLAMRNPWTLVLLFGLQPVVLGNFHSALTEPTNALVLAFTLYLFVSDHFKSAVIFASFLPLLRTEGLVLLGSMIPFVIVRKRLKLLPWFLTGTVVYSILAAIVSGDVGYFFKNNPYFKFENSGSHSFDPGSGSLFYFLENQRQITGFWITLLLVVTLILGLIYIIQRLNKKTPHELSQVLIWLLFPVYFGYLAAHSLIWYWGILGSHGLFRVFMVVAPVTALIAQYAIHKLMAQDVRILNRLMKVLTVVGCFLLGYPGAHLPYPWENKPSITGYPGMTQLEMAIEFVEKKGWSNYPIVHQFPELNVQMDLDPFVQGNELSNYSTFYIWSINKSEPEKDWLPDSSVVVWDNFHARRDAPMLLSEIRQLKKYKEVAYFPADISKTGNPNDTIYDVRVFIKSNK